MNTQELTDRWHGPQNGLCVDPTCAAAPCVAWRSKQSAPLHIDETRIITPTAAETTAINQSKGKVELPDKVIPGTLLNPWQVYTLRDALTYADQPWDWTIHDLLLKQSALSQSGWPHSMKSLSWLSATMGAPIEGKVWGHFDSTAKRTLFVETEDPEQVVRKRIQELSKGFNVTENTANSEGFHWMRTGPFNLVGSTNQIKRTLDQVKPDFMVLSTMQGLLGGRNWKEQQDMAPVNALIVGLAHDYCPIVTITHSPQNAKAKRAAGTITQEANYLTTTHFEKKSSGGGTIIRVTVDSKLGMGNRFNLRLITEGEEIRQVVYDGEHKESLRTRIEEFIATFGKEPPSWQEIVDEFGCTKQYAQKVLKGEKE